MQRHKLILEYDGSGFSGWQKQKNAITIQEVLENALFQITGENTCVIGCGRTDAGVHAVGQVAHFDLQKEISDVKLLSALNFYLRPYSVSILSCSLVERDFHARYSATSRTYLYKIENRDAPLALDQGRCWHIRYKLILDFMQEAAGYLEGTHDFTSYRAKSCQSKSAIRTVEYISFARSKDQFGQKIEVKIKADGFLHHMVRNIIGTLVLVGKCNIKPIDVKYILEAKDRNLAGMTAPAYGLYFFDAGYINSFF
ncbi:MAG: tRNA pseudouridine(38-40) synthase TruA [Rickettsiaceae bacterium]|nr:tRNA pseudouridine(38-40) synthase TruA [Rickettsiaceae bacterium]